MGDAADDAYNAEMARAVLYDILARSHAAEGCGNMSRVGRDKDGLLVCDVCGWTTDD
jgi:ribosomal protein L37AE/L43A